MVSMYMPMNPRTTGIPSFIVPVLPVPSAPLVCPPVTMASEYDSYMYGRFRYVERDYPNYRHIPFDWYQPPKQYHNVIHEDAAVITLNGPVPIDEFYRYYIYGRDIDDSDDSSYGSEEYDEEEYIPQPSMRTNNYSNYRSNRNYSGAATYDN